MKKLFSNRQTLIILLVFIITCSVISGISLWVVYKHSLEDLKFNLSGVVERQKSLITELKEAGKTDDEIIEFIKKTREHYYRIGAKGEIAIARRKNDSIIFLLVVGKNPNFKIGLSKHGIPMIKALNGETGFIKSEDYSGTKVYAAYGFLPACKWAVEAKLPTSEFNATFYKALIINLLFSVVLISIGLFFLIRYLKFIFNTHYSEILQSHILLKEHKEEIEAQNEEYRQINEELHKTRNEAIENASFNESLLQTIPFVLDIIDEEGTILYISEKSRKIAGKEVVGKKCWEVFRDTQTQCNNCPLKQQIDIGQTKVISTSKVLGNRFFDIYHTGILYKGKKAIMEILVDTTEQIRSRELNEILKHSLDIYTDGIYWMDSDNRFIYVNEAGGRAFGCKPEELLGKSLSDVNPTTTPEALADLWHKLRTEGFYTIETIHKRMDGSVFYVEVKTEYFQYDGKEYNCGFARDITDRKKFELELIQAKELAEENEKKYSALFHETITGIAIHKLIFDENQQPVDCITTDVNKAYEEIMSVQKEHVIGKKASELLSAEELKKWIDIFAPVALNGGQCHYENFSPQNNKYFEGNVFSIEKNQFVVAFSDISERKKAEAELLKREAIIRTAEEFLPIIFYIIDNNGIFKLSVGAGLKSLGLQPNQVVGYSAFELYKDYPEITNAIEKALANEMASFESHVNGAYHYNYVTPFPNVGIIGVALDITELKDTFRKLDQSREDYSKLFEDHAAVKLILDPFTGEIIDANHAAEKYYGWSREELRQMNISQINILAKQQINDLMAKAFSEQNIYFEFKHRLANGEIRDVEAFSSKIKFFDRDVLHTIVHDITDKKIVERELIAAKDKAEESDRLKTAFLQNISHEIRTPMNAIMGFSELLVNSFHDKPKLEYYTSIINQRCKDLLTIINDLLDISKIESGQLSVAKEKCDISKLFNELNMLFTEHKDRMKKQHIVFDMQARCNTQNVAITTDVVKLKQIFINLLNNAFKFTMKGKVEGGCFLDEKQQLIFYVSDTGVGIPPDKHQYVFERFSQLTTDSSPLHGGNGLGLSIVRGLVKILGGTIWLESEVGKGTTFYFTISVEDQSVLAEMPAEYQVNNHYYNFHGKSILIVEDDKYNMELIREFLSVLGAEILVAGNGREAINVALSQQPDLILMDIALPDITGYEAIHQIKQQKPFVKIIAQTAFATQDDQKKALDAGCVDYVSKPLNSQVLLSKIEKYLS